MSYNSSFTGQQADAALQRAAVIQKDGDGTKFLSDDGTYKEAGDKTNVLILSLENDLANGEKDSPITAEVSASLVDAITNGKACVIKSANSDILVNLQQIGSNVTIIMEQISRVGQTFVAVNTSITVNTSTNVIADYQTGAIVLETEGDGSKFLSNDGTYKEIASSNQYLDMSIFTGESGTLSEEDYQKVVDAFSNKVSVGAVQEAFMPISISDLSDKYEIYVNATGPGESYLGVGVYIYSINKSDKTFTFTGNGVRIENSGDGTKFLADDGTYKAVSGGDNLISQSDQNAILNAINSITNSELSSGGTLSEEKYNAIVSATPEAIKTLGGSSNGVYIRYDRFGQSTPTSGMVALSGIYTYNNGAISFMSRDLYTGLYLGIMGYNSVQFANLSISSSRQISYSLKNIQFDSSSDGTKFLSDDGSYKSVSSQPMKVLTESEYSALGTTPETDNVLYFVTPD